MGIFEGLGGFIENVLSGPVGQIGGQILLGREQARQQRRAGPPAITGFPSPGPGPIGGPVIRAGSTELARMTDFDPFQAGGVLPVATLPVPGPVPFGIDPQTPSFFRPARATVRPIRFITQMNPATGALVFWEHAGQPILFSRDLRVCKRVGRIASRSKRSMGRVTRRRKR